MTAILSAQGLEKSYRRRKVVHDVSFDVHAGEIVGLLGPNGAGKTTTFNMVAGLLPPDCGQVLLDGVDLGELPLFRRARQGLGYLPQETTVFRGLSVTDNLIAILEAQGLDASSCRQRANILIDRYNLGAVHDNLGSQLSGGERRRLDMARALIPEPKVVLLDEPFAALDPITVSELRGFIRNMRDGGIGVLLTDHRVRETLGTCDRAYLISEGRILLAGTPQKIVEDPVARMAYLGDDFEL